MLRMLLRKLSSMLTQMMTITRLSGSLVLSASMMTPELKKAMYDVMADIMDHTPWDPPFDQLESN